MRSLLLCLLLCLSVPATVLAETAPFDLAGPSLEVTVTHAGTALPVSQVPNLTAGDQLSIRAELPAAQSARYLLVAAFLRGATNPPPKEWFHRAGTWTPAGRGGLKITVPDGAQQLVVFLAPKTGGDFKTLVDAVRGRPGVFVRASQDLNQAALDRSRLDAFLTALRKAGPADPERLKKVTPLLARSLTIKLNTDCFQKMPELQAPCLMQGQEALVLNDGHSTSIVEALTSGNLGDLSLQLSVTPQAGYGYYSSYVGAVRDIARILDGLHTAQYQYIPALATNRRDRMALLLNTPPSFHNPLSVLVTALPAVEPPQAPPMQPVDPKAAFCTAKPGLVLPVEGAPLVYSTRYAHDMSLRIKTRDGASLELPAHADAEQGGFVVDVSGAAPGTRIAEAVLHGRWGFEPFDGPRFDLQGPLAGALHVSAEDEQGLVVGRSDTVRLEGPSAACVEAVSLRQADGQAQPLEWKAVQGDRLAITVPLTDAEPGNLTLLVKQYGLAEADQIPLRAFTQASRIEGFSFHAGDLSGVLKGGRLDQVAGLTLGGVEFTPGELVAARGGDELSLAASDTAALSRLKPGQAATAKIKLKDGRSASVRLKVGAPRPHFSLIGKSIQASPPKGAHPVQLTGPDELPQNAQLTFSVRAEPPGRFSGRETVEVATADGAASTTLSFSSGLTLEDAQVALATLDTAKAFNASTFGPLRFRVMQEGAAGDWQPLASLVRLPTLQELKCQGADKPCQLSGAGLFLIESVSGEPAFGRAVTVPQGFTGRTLAVPHPTSGRLYLRLRDDPEVINQVLWPALAGR